MTQTTNQMVREFERICAGPTKLLPMDRCVLAYLVQHGGTLPSAAIPMRLFRGSIPEDHPSLVDLGMIKHDGDNIVITEMGRAFAA